MDKIKSSNLKSANYVLAGIDTFVGLQGAFIDKYQKDHYDDIKLDNFLQNTVNKFLYSFGSFLNYKSKTFKENYSEKIIAEISRMISRPFMKNTKLYIDSGGFQIAMGALTTDKMPEYIKVYHEFLKNNYQTFSHAFHLDIPPGPGSADIFQSYKQIEDLNRLSYQTTSKLPKEIKDKMIYIHHFRTPSLFDMYSKFLWNEDLADGFSYFGTGGIVAAAATDMVIPVIIYCIPLSSILKYAIQKKITSFKFHVLGGANYIDVIYHKLFSYHIKKVHNIDVQITYDSSSIFKGLAQGRIIPVFKEGGILDKMDIRSVVLHQKFEKDVTIEDKLYLILNEMSKTYNFKELSKVDDPIYDTESGTFSRSTYMYLFCYMLYMYKQMEIVADQFVKELYLSFENGKFEEFDQKFFDMYRKFNGGRSSRKQKAKSYSVYKSLQILTNLDEEYNRNLISKFMSADDVSGMVGGGVLKF